MYIRPIALTAFLACGLLVSAAETGTNVPSHLTAAKVFLRGAQLTRTASVPLSGGASTLVFTGLSQNMDPQSIQVTGKGNFTILSVNQRMNYLSESPKKKELDELQERMKKVDRSIATENVQLAVWANEEQLLNKNASIGGQQTGVTLGQLTAVNDYIRERLRAAKTGQWEQQQKIADLQEEKTKLQVQIAALQALGQRPTSEVVVEITSAAPANASFTLSYYVGQAGWMPAYDLRASGTGKPVDLLMKAVVTNNTGEDWQQVDLSLSSGNPTLGSVMPQLQPWTLNIWRPVPVYRNAGAAARSMAKSEDSALSEVTITADAIRRPVVTVSEQTTTKEYAIALPFSVPSDGNPHTLAVQEHTLAASYTWIATPKLDKDAFLYARTTGWEDLDLLSGEANVFFEGTYVGKSQLDLGIAKDTMEISLGRDKGIVVERTKRKASNQRSIIGGSRTMTVGWDITVRNTKGTVINLELRDQYPLSPQSEIEVKLVESGGATVNKDTGLLTWKLDLAPKESKNLGFAYSVKYPKDLPVVLE